MNPSPYPAPFTSAHGRARVVKLLLIVGAVVTGMSLLAEALSLVFPPLSDDQELGDNLVGAAITLSVFLLALLEFILYLTTVVSFSMWLYRAHNNLRSFDPLTRLSYSAGWAVGSYFVPFVNLVVPYRAIKEVWQKSRLPEDALLFETDPPRSFPIWWLFWLLASFAGNLSMRASFNENVSESTATMISMVASALSILAAIFAFVVVRGIDQRQEEASGKAQLGKFSGPPSPPANLPLYQMPGP